MAQKVDSQRMATASREIRENINRAKGYLRRDEMGRALACVRDALVQKTTAGALGFGRSEVELLFREVCDDFSRHPRLQALFVHLGLGGGTVVRYVPGEELLLLKRFTAIQIKFEELEAQERQQHASRQTAQKAAWLEAGRQSLAQKNWPKGKVYLRRVAEAFGDEEGVLRDVGGLFAEAELLNEAVEMYGLAIEKFPNDEQAWRLAIAAYDALGEFKKAEVLYQDALKIFGPHPLTYLNMAKFYAKWHKKDEALEYAQRALALDGKLAEALAIRDSLA